MCRPGPSDLVSLGQRLSPEPQIRILLGEPGISLAVFSWLDRSSAVYSQTLAIVLEDRPVGSRILVVLAAVFQNSGKSRNRGAQYQGSIRVA